MRLGDQKLLQLASILQRVPQVHEDSNGNIVGYHQCDITHACGTPSCAWGWWLYGNKRRHARLARADGHGSHEIQRTMAMWSDPIYRIYVSFRSKTCQEEFEIDDREQGLLFEGDGMNRAKTGKEAAAFIRRFVADRNKETV